jgi:amidase
MHPTELPWHDQFVEGPMARSAVDCALMLDAMTGLCADAPLSLLPPWKSAFDMVRGAQSLKGKRLAWCADIAGIGADPEVAEVCRAAAFALAQAGAQVEEVAFDLSDGRPAFLALRAVAMLGIHWERKDMLERVNANLAGNVRAGFEVTGRDIAAAERKRAEIWQRWRAMFERYDLVLAPATPVAPFPVEQNFPAEVNGRKLANYVDWIAPTFLVSLAALPAASAPAGLTRAGLPIGLQIVGPRLSEPQILSAAAVLEQLRPVGRPKGY